MLTSLGAGKHFGICPLPLGRKTKLQVWVLGFGVFVVILAGKKSLWDIDTPEFLIHIQNPGIVEVGKVSQGHRVQPEPDFVPTLSPAPPWTPPGLSKAPWAAHSKFLWLFHEEFPPHVQPEAPLELPWSFFLSS